MSRLLRDPTFKYHSVASHATVEGFARRMRERRKQAQEKPPANVRTIKKAKTA